MNDKTRCQQDADLDPEHIKLMRDALGGQFEAIMQSFFVNATRQAGLMHQALWNKDRALAVALAHKLAASAGQVGFVKMAHLARSIETQADHTAFDDLLGVMAALCSAIERAKTAIHVLQTRE